MESNKNKGPQTNSLADRMQSAASEADRIRLETAAADRRPSITPMTWQELCEAIDSDNLEILGRSPQGQAQYVEKRREIAKKFKIGSHYLLNRVWSIGLEVDPESGLLVAVQNQPHDRMVFLKNDFPYNLERGVSHYILWGRSESSLKSVTSDLELLKQYLPPELHEAEIKYCINPPNLQSIKEIPHAHIFIRSNQ